MGFDEITSIQGAIAQIANQSNQESLEVPPMVFYMPNFFLSTT